MEEALSGFQLKLVFASLAIVLALALVSLYFARRISKPLEEMKEGAERFAEGELGSPLNTPDSLELAGLAQALNEMAVQLDDRIGTVVRQRQELEALLSSMAEGVIAVDNDLRILSINRPALDILLTGNTDAVVGKPLGEVIERQPQKAYSPQQATGNLRLFALRDRPSSYEVFSRNPAASCRE